MRKNSNPIAKGKHSWVCKKDTEGYCRVDKKHWLEGYPLLGYSVGDPDTTLDLVDVPKSEHLSKHRKNNRKSGHIGPTIEDLINHFKGYGSSELPERGTPLRNFWNNCTRSAGRSHADEFDAACVRCSNMRSAYETKINKKRKAGGGPSGRQRREEIPARALLRNKRKKVETSDDDDDDDDDDDSDNSDNDDEFLRNSRKRTREFRATLARCKRTQGGIAKVLKKPRSKH